MTRGRLNTHRKGSCIAPKASSANAGIVDSTQQFFFKRCTFGSRCGSVYRTHQCLFCKRRNFIKRCTHAHTHYQRRARVCCLFANAGNNFFYDPCTPCSWGKHDHTACVIGAPAFQHKVHATHSWLRHKVNISKSRGVILCVFSVKQRIFHERFTQAPFGICLSNRSVYQRKHVSWHHDIRPHFQAYPRGAGVLAKRHLIGACNSSVFLQQLKRLGSKALRFCLC